MNAPAFFVVAAEVARLRRREVGRSPPNRYGPRGKYMPVFSALCVFSGTESETNPDAAAEALRAAGYQVFRLPPELKNSEVEGDDFLEIRREGDADDDAINAVWADAQRVVDPSLLRPEDAERRARGRCCLRRWPIAGKRRPVRPRTPGRRNLPCARRLRPLGSPARRLVLDLARLQAGP